MFFIIGFAAVANKVKFIITKMKALNLRNIKIIKLYSDHISNRLILRPIPLYILTDDD